MYISIKEVKTVTNKKFNEKAWTNHYTKIVLEGILRQQFFRYNNRFYSQKGLAMGSTSNSIQNILARKWRSKFLNKLKKKYEIFIYATYLKILNYLEMEKKTMKWHHTRYNEQRHNSNIRLKWKQENQLTSYLTGLIMEYVTRSSENRHS